jgi:hypothetical protein
MKPHFALSLSFDGIRLLLRAAGGWQRVGEASVNSPDLAGELSALRDMAAKLRPGRVRSKLIIPDDQIRYLSVETGPLTHAERIEAARLALDGATPYPVEALTFDISTDGDMTHVAAVAKETLTEAEAFASEHRFNPVSFVAAPTDAGFLGEPFFGRTALSKSLLAAGKSVEPDGVRVVVVGDAEIPEETQSAVAQAVEPPAEPDATPDAESDVAVEAEAEMETLNLAPPQSEASDVPDPAPVAKVADPDEPAAKDAVAKKDESAATAPAHAPDAPVAAPPIDPPKPDPVAALGFASRRGSPITAATPLAGVTREAPAPNAPSAAKSGPAPVPPPPIAPPKATTDSLRPVDPPTPSTPPEPVAPAAATRAASFLSRRKLPNAGAKTSAPNPADIEAKRMTVFGAREAEKVGGKPRYLGLILMAVLIVFLAGVAAWASVFLDDGLARLFHGRDRTLASTLPDDTKASLADDVGATTSAPDEAAEDGIDVAALNEGLSDGLTAEDAAILDALRDPLPDPQPPEELDAAALEARYAVTGIWPQAPAIPQASVIIPLEDLYITSIDPVSPALDAVALPPAASFGTDSQLAIVTSPAAAGTNFALGQDGRVIATAVGALSPDGFTVFLGRPPVVPPTTPVRFATDPTEGGTLGTRTQLRPRARPTDLVEQNERATLGGLSRSELADYRPRLRPQSAQQDNLDQDTQDDTPPSALATAQSLRPTARPQDFERIVARATPSDNTAAAAASTASVAPRTVAPSIPSSASVTREATVRNAINLGRLNLIGVYGKPSDRRALVRLANGRYQKVQVGDRIDGGRVSAIGEGELRYQKGSRNVVLKMPQG